MVKEFYSLKCSSESLHFGIHNSPGPLTFPKVNLRKNVVNAKCLLLTN